ncbi:SWIM zinc finger family protein [Janthinobacterium sp. FW305-129]|uniref:SWIM zinc finger family protein n=1 Tax=Janthinobacterium sp. FW305-129 TaxID=2775054 RepID=UPI001E5F94F1|nr:SWIM zinc finger family protein [Janthinobacterium sp. FW305-129]MCC7599174.1 SWIM zinc finger family protein [Janthinobacterium sp. FW305-129]
MSWHAVYRSFDDDSLATLANAGLLRRALKDVEAGKVGWQDDVGGALVADGQRVLLDAGGPQKGRCDCPAPGICKHILAAAVWLRELPQDVEQDSEQEGSPAGVQEEVLALDSAAVCKQAGKPAVRQALAWLAEGDQADVTIVNARLQIELPLLKLGCSYLRGAGVDAMVSDTPAALRKALHLYALACVWRKHGREFAWPDGAAAAPVAAAQGMSTSELVFLAQVRRLLGELYDNGLSHASAIAAGQLRALTMSARSENLPRLAALLRGLGGTLDLLVRRDYHASERQAFEEMAAISALCAALEHAPGPLLQRLRGQARRSFDAAGDAPLELLPLGAYWWETRGGAHGLTLSFWQHAEGRIVQAVLARPDASDHSFTRESAWDAGSLWAGAGSARHMCEASWQLAGASLADDGRLAMDSRIRASAAPLWALDDARWQSLGFSDWTALAAFMSGNVGLAPEPIDCVLLRPAAVARPQLDEVAQRLDWQVFDASGAALDLQIPALPALRPRITRLQAAVADGADIRAVLASRARGEAGGWQPVALLIAKNAKLRVVSLDFEIDAGKLPSALARFFKSLGGTSLAPSAPQQASAASRVLAQVLDLLALQARSGRPRLEAELAGELARHGATLRALGLDLPAGLLAAYVSAPRAPEALRLAYVCTTCIALEAAG